MPPLQSTKDTGAAITAGAAEASKKATELHNARYHLGGSLQLDVKLERQGSDAPYGRLHGAGGEVYGGCNGRDRTPSE